MYHVVTGNDIIKFVANKVLMSSVLLLKVKIEVFKCTYNYYDAKWPSPSYIQSTTVLCDIELTFAHS